MIPQLIEEDMCYYFSRNLTYDFFYLEDDKSVINDRKSELTLF